MPSDRKPTSQAGESFDLGPLDVQDDEMGDTNITDWAIAQLDSQLGRPEEPLFMAVGYYRPHIPLWAPRRYFEPFNTLRIELPVAPADDLFDLPVIARRWATEPITAGSHATVLRFGQWGERGS